MPTAPPKHRPAGWKPRPAWSTTATSSTKRGYGWRWQKLRALVLAEEPLCRSCQPSVVAAVAVDHIVPKARGGTDDRSNLQPLCQRCHDEKTAQDRMRG